MLPGSTAFLFNMMPGGFGPIMVPGGLPPMIGPGPLLPGLMIMTCGCL